MARFSAALPDQWLSNGCRSRDARLDQCRIDILRRLYDGHLDGACAGSVAAPRHDRTISVLLVDIDRCKLVNDRFDISPRRGVAEDRHRLLGTVHIEDALGRQGR